MTRTRIVAVSYLNTIPYIYGITRAGGSLREGLLLCPPRLCAEALRTGEANVGLIPVAAIPEIPDLQIITPFCIGASGPVRTVVLASDYPVEELDTIWLDSHSRTSVRLARILAAEKWGIAPQWRPLTDYSFGTGAAAGTHGTIPAAEATGTGGAAGTGTVGFCPHYRTAGPAPHRAVPVQSQPDGFPGRIQCLAPRSRAVHHLSWPQQR